MTDYTKREFQDEAADLYGDDIAKIIRTAAALHAVLTEYGPPSAWVCEQWAVILGHALNPPEEPATVLDLDSDGPLDFTDDDRINTGGHCFTSNKGECLNGFDWGGGGPNYNG